MKKEWVLISLMILLSIEGKTQEWSVFLGGGLSYDGFLRDKEVMTAKAKWPFQLGANIHCGAEYRTESGFNVFAEFNTGITRLQFPVPDVKKSNNFYEQIESRLMVGSGPKLLVGNKGNFLTPFVQLGAAYFSNYGQSGVGKDDEQVSISLGNDIERSSVQAVCGAGIDWRFEALVPSSINFQVVYTPLPIFTEPVSYKATTKNGVYDLKLQGKLLQVMLSYKVHIPLKSLSRR